MPITALTTAAISGAAATKVIERAITDLYNSVKSKTDGLLKTISIHSAVKNLRDHALTTRRVKTLWQVDKAVDLLEFYCDSHIICNVYNINPRKPPQKIRKKITSISDFSTPRSVLLQGIAGQGKSILLRYLCSAELLRGNRIPLFIELHRIQPNESLSDHILRCLRMLAFRNLEKSHISNLCETKKLIFFLDGFDEVPEAQRAGLINEIEELDSIAPGLFVISSRPESGIEMSTRLDIEKLDNLKNTEYQAVIRRLSDDIEYSNTLIGRIERHTGHLRDLLCTPLLVTLLVISYKSSRVSGYNSNKFNWLGSELMKVLWSVSISSSFRVVFSKG